MRFHLLFLFMLVLMAFPLHAEFMFSGNVVATTDSINTVDFKLEQGGLARVQILGSNLARVRFNPSGVLSSRVSPTLAGTDFDPPSPEISNASNFTLITTDKMQVIVGKNPFEILVVDPEINLIVRDSTPAVGWDPETGMIVSRKIAPMDEFYFGFGERGGPLNRRGRTFIMRNVDKFAYTEFSDPLYQSYPFYYGMREGRVYGMFWDNPAFPSFSMNAEHNGIITYAAQKGELDYYIIAGPETQTVANTYAQLTGFTPLPPKWTLGYHHSRYGWSSEGEILTIAEELRNQQFPCDVLYFDIDYMDQLHIFTWNPTTFPDPLQMNTTLKNQGFKSINIMEPLLLTTDPLWSEADDAGYFLQDATGNSIANDIWYGHVSWVDFTKDGGANWYKNHLKTFLEAGIDGLWNDLNEPAQNFMAEAIYNFNGDPRLDLEARNLYALFHAKTSREAMTELRPNIRPWNFIRSGTSGIQRYGCTWSGDTSTSFDSLRVSIQISIHMGLSGQNQFGHDIGGFLGDPSPELFVRWLEFSAFTSLFRNHSVNTALPREPWVYGEPYTSIIRETIENRYRWLPYLYTLFEEASRTAAPVLCPTFFYTPGRS